MKKMILAVESGLDWKTNENFEIGIVKTIEWYIGKYNVFK